MHTKFLRHEPQAREQVGAENGQDIPFSYVQFWNFDTWLEMLAGASNKMHCAYCLTLLEIPYERKLTSIVQDLHMIRGQSFKED